jgi:nucleotide-binding universal stress UspA family protein
VKTFLVAIDGSPVARAVLETAVDYARPLGARMVLLRVVGLPPELPTEALTGSPENLAAVLSAATRMALAELAAFAPPELVASQRVEIGSPWQTICEVARAEEADLIVIGSHGYGVMDRLLGTTAARVVNHADRPVLVVHPRSARSD